MIALYLFLGIVLLLHLFLFIVALICAIRLKEKEKLHFFLINLVPILGPVFCLFVYAFAYSELQSNKSDISYKE